MHLLVALCFLLPPMSSKSDSRKDLSFKTMIELAFFITIGLRHKRKEL